MTTKKTVPAVHRFAAMANYTDALLFTAPGSLASGAAKAVFYVLRNTPEWAVGTLLLAVNVKGSTVCAVDTGTSEALVCTLFLVVRRGILSDVIATSCE